MVDIDLLVRQAQAGDRQALESLVAHFDRYVFGVALLTLGDRVEAQDAAQDALLKAWRGLRRYKGEAAFQTWLYRIIVNTCHDLGRRLGRRREAALDEAMFLPGPLQTELDREQQQAVWRAVRALDAPLLKVVILRYYLDMPCAEIGQVTGEPVNTVYWRLHQARRQLESSLLTQDVLTEDIAARQPKGA